jgi:hypothetical protein
MLMWSRNLMERGGHSPCWAAEPEKKIYIYTVYVKGDIYFKSVTMLLTL